VKNAPLAAALGALVLLLAPSRAAALEELDWRSNSHLRFGAGWYASPWEGMALDGYQVGLGYHYALSPNALLGPVFNYSGLKAERPIEDLPKFSSADEDRKLRIHQTRLGLKGMLSPQERLGSKRGRRSGAAPVWFYGALDTGIAFHQVSERDELGLTISDGSADWYLKPGIGALFAPRSPLTVFVEVGYTLVPTYAFTDKSFNLYGAPEPLEVDLNTDGFVLEAGLAWQF
jgi:hypothetical protein